MKRLIYLIFFAVLFVKVRPLDGVGSRVKRQLFYQDIQNKPKNFRSRPEEKGASTNEHDLVVEFPPVNIDLIVNSLSKIPPTHTPLSLPLLENSPIEPILSKAEPKPTPTYKVPPSSPKSPSESLKIAVETKDRLSKDRVKGEKKNPIPGIAGQDYPIYNKVPFTTFSCSNVPFRPGMYANPETGCQAYHVCHDDRHGDQGASFLCTNGTLFNQETFNCDWWYKVDCSQATSFYRLNTEPEFNPYYQKEYKDREQENHEMYYQYSEPDSDGSYLSSSINNPHLLINQARDGGLGGDISNFKDISLDFWSRGVKREISVPTKLTSARKGELSTRSPLQQRISPKATNGIISKSSLATNINKKISRRTNQPQPESPGHLFPEQTGTSFLIFPPKKPRTSPYVIVQETDAVSGNVHLAPVRKPLRIRSGNNNNNVQQAQPNTFSSNIQYEQSSSSDETSKRNKSQSKLSHQVNHNLPREIKTTSRQRPFKGEFPPKNTNIGTRIISPFTSPPRRRVIKRRKRPLSSQTPTSKVSQVGLGRPPVKKIPRRQFHTTTKATPTDIFQDLPGDVIVDFEWGQRA